MSDPAFITTTLTELVQTKSINPAFSDGEPSDEREIATRLGGIMRALGMETTEYEAAPGRVSVVGRLRGTGGGRSLMLYGHIDTSASPRCLSPSRQPCVTASCTDAGATT